MLGDHVAEDLERSSVDAGRSGQPEDVFGSAVTDCALLADGSGNNRAGGFNFALVGPGVNDAGNNEGGGFNVAILPRPGQNCSGPACFNFLGAQFGN
jgi:hypothetical protein